MAVETYSNRADGAKKLSEHFRVREFACKDGSDKVLIDEKLVRKLETLRCICGKAVTITSGYRTPSHNRAVGGASSSYHTRGQAADIIASSKTPGELAKIAQAIGLGGIEVNLDSKYLHIDTRTSRYYWTHQGGRDITQNTFGGACPYATPTVTVKRGQKGTNVRWLQWWLKLWGYAVTIDGDFGARTENALKEFQTARGIDVDGMCGKNTRAELRGD